MDSGPAERQREELGAAAGPGTSARLTDNSHIYVDRWILCN